MPILVSDIHLHEYPRQATFKHGYNRRLLDGISVFKQICEFAANRDKKIFILGDLFYDREKLSTIVQSKTYQVFSYAKKMGIHITVIPGNHDFSPGGEYHHSLCCISECAQIITRPYYDERFGVFWIPYTSSKKKFLTACEQADKMQAKTLLTHQGYSYKNVSSNWAFFIDEICSPKELPSMQIISGHYHNYAIIRKDGFYLGSPLQLNWGDEHIEKFVWYTKDFSTFKSFQCRYPKFQTLHVQSIQDLKTYDVKNHFVRLQADKDFNFLEAHRWLKTQHPRFIDLPIKNTDKKEEQVFLEKSIELLNTVESEQQYIKSLKIYSKFLSQKHHVDYKKLFMAIKRILHGHQNN